MIFSLRAEFTFEAKSIDDANEKLSSHFMSLTEGESNGHRAIDMLTGYISVAPRTAQSFAEFCLSVSRDVKKDEDGKEPPMFHGIPKA